METLDLIHEQQETFDATKIEDIQEEIAISHRSMDVDGSNTQRVGNRNFVFGRSYDNHQPHVIK